MNESRSNQQMLKWLVGTSAFAFANALMVISLAANMQREPEKVSTYLAVMAACVILGLLSGRTARRYYKHLKSVLGNAASSQAKPEVAAEGGALES
ncbi:hypothetical protein SAMN05216576_107224 [Ectopseudomonas chengduensis]|jgi:hypothetical protein|uniref:Uncharacterized protein n=1 Tax=Ectopseudomonas chengduensis TaxID=489632 RepID=A0A1G6Q2N9_9GAMM|nr:MULTISPECIES: hypothetical protein [Pseudomonas]MBP3062051.1 hypothetical protein [Pseudomonas chengduensis]NNB75343.1 hypothetical protein [Pseudomonas chengduensis]OEO24409.1 hypothetical protein AX279_17220 [Pseudomonas sp. J237]CRN66517.1 hypothetical protein PAERUG_P40_Scotland_4_VIM_2_09_12_04091 [Pseudomonas aeruginosa]SDC86623.1 hypothetical protein SAMN05216576_107224 [Pseudomonas chengduensis]